MRKITRFTIACVVLGLPLTTYAQQQPSQKNDSPFSTEVDSTTLALGARSLTREYLQELPFRGTPQDYYGLFPGTVQQDYRGIENLHIRGSRHDEVGYTFEDVDVRSAYTGRNLIRFIPEALENITLQSSPTASSGPAVALLQHRLRRGGDNFKLSLRGETDRFTSDYQSRFDTYSYGYYDYLLMAEGKIVKDNIRFFAAGESESFADHYRKFWEGFRIGGSNFPLVDVYTGESMQSVFGTDEIVVRPGNIPHAASDRHTANSIVTANFAPFNLRAIGVYNREKQRRNDTPIQHLFNPARIPEFMQKAGLFSLQADYAGPKDLTARLQLDFLSSNDKTYDPLFENDFLLYRDSLAIVAKGLPWNASPMRYGDSYIRGPGDFYAYYFHFNRPGDLITSYTKSEENYWGISGSVEKKLGRHQLIAGGAWQRRTLRRFAIGNSLNFMSRFREFGLAPNQLNEEQLLTIRNSGDVRTFGYDIFGKKIEATDAISDAPRHPSTYSLYAEERYRTQNLLMYIGLRYDTFSSDAPIFIDPTSPEMTFGSSGNIPPSTMQTAPSHHYLLPRLNTTFFANDRLAFQFHFGKYVQQVQLRDVYGSRAYLRWLFSGGYFINDPLAFNAEPVQATQTVVGVSYQMQPKLHAQALWFYKLIEGQLETAQIIYRPWEAGYNVLSNSGEATAKGIELSLRYNHKRLGAWLSYALSDVRGFTSYPISNLRDVDWGVADGFNSKSNPPSPLDYNQKHRGNVLVTYQFDRHTPFWLRHTGLHLLFRFNSGHNFTLYQGGFG